MRFPTIVMLTLILATQAFAGREADGQVTHIPASRVTAAFSKGEPLVETGFYKVHASLREAPGRAEVHVRDTDIIYVIDGSATIVTGGRVVDPSTASPDEIRGRAIRDGVEQALAKGDVFIVPSGVPHWFTRVQPPFRYYVVKATASEGGIR